MKSMKKRIRLYKIAAVCLIFLLGGSVCIKSAAASLNEAEQEREDLEQKLKEAKDVIAELKQSRDHTEENLKELNSQLLDISEQITSLENQLEQKNIEILNTKEQLEEAQETEKQQYEDMKLRIQFMYENSYTSYLNLILQAEDIPTLLNSVEYVSEIQRYDREKLEEYNRITEYIAQTEAKLEQEYAELGEMKASVEQQKADVAALMQEKEQELAALAEDIEKAQSEEDYYEAELQAQNELIAEIRRIEAEKAAAGISDQPYAGGAFLWPCPGSSRVTSDYGNRPSPVSGASTNHKGIDIGAPEGTDIVAASSGTVTAASYSSAAGNYVMVAHGGGVYTVYMHASALLVSPGQEVSGGQVIAKVGNTGISTASHLHFGVSLNGSYVNPWSYLGG